MRNFLKDIKQRKATLRAYQDFFKTRNGQLILHDLMKVTGYTGSILGDNPHETSYNEGRRSVVVQILQTVNASPEIINKHLKVIQQQAEELNDE